LQDASTCERSGNYFVSVIDSGEDGAYDGCGANRAFYDVRKNRQSQPFSNPIHQRTMGKRRSGDNDNLQANGARHLAII